MVEIIWKSVVIGLVFAVILSSIIEGLVTLLFGSIIGLFGGIIGFLIATIYVGYAVGRKIQKWCYPWGNCRFIYGNNS